MLKLKANGKPVKKLEAIRQLAFDLQAGKKSVASLRLAELELMLKLGFPLKKWISLQQTIDKPLER